MATAATRTLDPTLEKPPRRRRWIPLSLRMFVVFLLILTGTAAWIIVKGCRQAAVVGRIQDAGGFVVYRGEADDGGKMRARGAQPRGPAWLRKRIGNDFFDEPVSVHLHYFKRYWGDPEASRDVLLQVFKLPHLQSLSIDGVEVLPEDLSRIAEMRELRSLYLGERTLDDIDLEPLRGLPLEFLAIPRTRISDKGLRSVKWMSSLRHLDLTRTRVSDKGALELAELRNLRMLRLERCKVTLEGAKRLKASLPDCEIIWDSLEKRGTVYLR